MELKHEGGSIVVTPLADAWRVEYQGQTAESRFLEYAIAEAVGVSPKEAISFATRAIEEHLDASVAGTSDSEHETDSARPDTDLRRSASS